MFTLKQVEFMTLIQVFWSTTLRSIGHREVDLLLEGVNATLCRKAKRKETVRFYDFRLVLFKIN